MPALTIEQKLYDNETAAMQGEAAPYCTALTYKGEMCLKASTGETDYCRRHEEKPHTNYGINDQCAHENFAGKRCKNMVWPSGDYCETHRACWIAIHGGPSDGACEEHDYQLTRDR